MKEIIFDREKIAAYNKLTTNWKAKVGLDGDDVVKDLVTVIVESEIYSNLADERTIDHNFGKPSFFDWLLGRERKVSIEVKAKDLLLNPPPEHPDTQRIYLIDKKY